MTRRDARSTGSPGGVAADYSVRNAIIGSTETARRAGTKLATAASSVTAISAPAYDHGSRGVKPKSIDSRKRDPAKASGNPSSDAGEADDEAVADDHPHHVIASRTERDAKANLRRAAGDAVRQRAVEADCDEERGEHAECRRQA